MSRVEVPVQVYSALDGSELVQLAVKVGDKVSKGDKIAVVLKSGKMRIQVKSPVSGMIQRLNSEVGQVVRTHQPIAVITTDSSSMTKEYDCLQKVNETMVAIPKATKPSINAASKFGVSPLIPSTVVKSGSSSMRVRATTIGTSQSPSQIAISAMVAQEQHRHSGGTTTILKKKKRRRKNTSQMMITDRVQCSIMNDDSRSEDALKCALDQRYQEKRMVLSLEGAAEPRSCQMRNIWEKCWSGSLNELRTKQLKIGLCMHWNEIREGMTQGFDSVSLTTTVAKNVSGFRRRLLKELLLQTDKLVLVVNLSSKVLFDWTAVSSDCGLLSCSNKGGTYDSNHGMMKKKQGTDDSNPIFRVKLLNKQQEYLVTPRPYISSVLAKLTAEWLVFGVSFDSDLMHNGAECGTNKGNAVGADLPMCDENVVQSVVLLTEECTNDRFCLNGGLIRIDESELQLNKNEPTTIGNSNDDGMIRHSLQSLVYQRFGFSVENGDNMADLPLVFVDTLFDVHYGCNLGSPSISLNQVSVAQSSVHVGSMSKLGMGLDSTTAMIRMDEFREYTLLIPAFQSRIIGELMHKDDSSGLMECDNLFLSTSTLLSGLFSVFWDGLEPGANRLSTSSLIQSSRQRIFSGLCFAFDREDCDDTGMDTSISGDVTMAKSNNDGRKENVAKIYNGPLKALKILRRLCVMFGAKIADSPRTSGVTHILCTRPVSLHTARLIDENRRTTKNQGVCCVHWSFAACSMASGRLAEISQFRAQVIPNMFTDQLKISDLNHVKRSLFELRLDYLQIALSVGVDYPTDSVVLGNKIKDWMLDQKKKEDESLCCEIQRSMNLKCEGNKQSENQSIQTHTPTVKLENKEEKEKQDSHSEIVAGIMKETSSDDMKLESGNSTPMGALSPTEITDDDIHAADSAVVQSSSASNSSSSSSTSQDGSGKDTNDGSAEDQKSSDETSDGSKKKRKNPPIEEYKETSNADQKEELEKTESDEQGPPKKKRVIVSELVSRSPGMITPQSSNSSSYSTSSTLPTKSNPTTAVSGSNSSSSSSSSASVAKEESDEMEQGEVMDPTKVLMNKFISESEWFLQKEYKLDRDRWVSIEYLLKHLYHELGFGLLKELKIFSVNDCRLLLEESQDLFNNKYRLRTRGDKFSTQMVRLESRYHDSRSNSRNRSDRHSEYYNDKNPGYHYDRDYHQGSYQRRPYSFFHSSRLKKSRHHHYHHHHHHPRRLPSKIAHYHSPMRHSSNPRQSSSSLMRSRSISEDRRRQNLSELDDVLGGKKPPQLKPPINVHYGRDGKGNNNEDRYRRNEGGARSDHKNNGSSSSSSGLSDLWPGAQRRRPSRFDMYGRLRRNKSEEEGKSEERDLGKDSKLEEKTGEEGCLNHKRPSRFR